MRYIEALNEARYGGNVDCNGQAIAEDILAEVQDFLQRVKSMVDDDSDDELAENETMIDGQQILEVEHKIWRCDETFVPLDTSKFRYGFSICGKKWTQCKEVYEKLQDQKISKALLSTALSNASGRQSVLVSVLEASAQERGDVGSRGSQHEAEPIQILGQCNEHRLHNLGKRVVRSLDPEAIRQSWGGW